jgi:hypothetical protein
MEIVKNKRKSKCGICRKPIESNYKVYQKHNYHLRCYYNWLVKRLLMFKEYKRKLNRYKKYMILEGLLE